MTPSSGEDFAYLSTLRDKKYIIMISPYVKYFIHGNDDKNIVSQTGNRVILNNNQKEGFEISRKNILLLLTFFLLFFLMICLFLFNKKPFYKYKYKYFFAGLLVIIIIYLFSVHFSM
jgi:glucan phosphoethanolaminetransferase (alkaline phosphatase superfamily)